MIYYMVNSGDNMDNFTIWFTGLTDSGKTTLATKLHKYLNSINYAKYIELVDANEYRSLYCNIFGFSKRDRDANVMSMGVLAYYLNKNDRNVIIASIAPYNDIREHNRQLINQNSNYFEVYCKCDLDILKERDTKGLYSDPDNLHQTGIDDPYETPSCPDITVDTGLHDVNTCFMNIMLALNMRGIISNVIMKGLF